MRKKLSVIFILAAAIACAVLFTACVDNVAYPSDMYGDFYVAGKYANDDGSISGDRTITDFGRGVTIKEEAEGFPRAYLNSNGFEEVYYAKFDLNIANTIELKKDNRWGDTMYTLDIIDEDTVSLTLTPDINGVSDGGQTTLPGESETIYFVRAAD